MKINSDEIFYKINDIVIKTLIQLEPYQSGEFK